MTTKRSTKPTNYTFRGLRSLAIGYGISSLFFICFYALFLPGLNLSFAVFVDAAIECALILAASLVYLAGHEND